MGLSHRLTRQLKRIILPLVALIYILASAFDLHTRNLLNNNFAQLSPYTGGPFDDVKRIRCYAWYGSCNQIIERTYVDDSGQETTDPREVTWLKVPKHLDLNGNRATNRWTLYHDFLYVKPSTRGPSAPGKAIVDMVIGDPGSAETPSYVVNDVQHSTGRAKSRLDITYNYNNWDRKQDGVWVKYDKDSAADAIVDIQYLFGHDIIEPREDWTLINGALQFQGPSPLRLIVKRPRPEGEDLLVPLLKQTAEEQFKVLQLSDMHFSSDFGKCKDQVDPLSKTENCRADAKSLNFIHEVLDQESPQLVVITGDILDGLNTFDYHTALLKALSPMISKKIPYAIALGEHDFNKYATRTDIVDFITTLPYSMMVRTSFNQTYHSITNYVLPILNHQGTQVVNAIYVLDLYSKSHSFTDEPEFHTSDFLRSAYASLEQKPKFSLAFQHYPIQEYRPKDAFAIVGEYNEKHALKSKTDKQTRKLLSEIDVQALSVGAEHTNECCIRSEGKAEGLKELWMCFGGSVGEAAYGDGKHDRRVRLFRMDTKNKEIASWKRRQALSSAVFDYQYIYKE